MRLWILLLVEVVVAEVVQLFGYREAAAGLCVGCSLAMTVLLWPTSGKRRAPRDTP